MRILLFYGRQERSEPLERFIVPIYSLDRFPLDSDDSLPTDPKEVDLPQPLLPRIRQRIGIPNAFQNTRKRRHAHTSTTKHDRFLHPLSALMPPNNMKVVRIYNNLHSQTQTVHHSEYEVKVG